MSNQVFGGPDNGYWLSARGLDVINFNKLSSPPLAFLNKGIVYELNDGILYYNGNAILTSASPTTVASFLATTGASVNVSLAAPPTLGQVLTATSATTSDWETPSSQFLDTEFFVVDDVDPTNRIAFDIGGTGETTTLFQTNATFDRTLVLPDASTNLVGCDGIVGTDSIPVFSTGNPAAISASSATISSGILNCSGIEIPSSDGTDGMISQNSNPLLHTFGTDNLFMGLLAGNFTITGNQDIGLGRSALENISSGSGNTACGVNSLQDCTSGDSNSGFGNGSLTSVTTGASNTGCGSAVGISLTSGNRNVMVGQNMGNALTTGSNNIFIGHAAAQGIITGSDNIVIGQGAGGNLNAAEANNILIDNLGTAGQSNYIKIGNAVDQTKCAIAGIRGVTTDVVDAIPVLIDSTGQLGTVSSSIKFKHDIEPLYDSEIIYKMNPVSFKYKDRNSSKKSIGLIAEEVEEFYKDMCIYQNGELLTLDYDRLIILLLAEVQKLKNKIDSLI